MTKTKIAIVFLLAFSLMNCENEEIKTDPENTNAVSPVIVINGKKIDTACLYSNYTDRGANVFEDKDGIPNCNDRTLVSDVMSTVNTNLPGTYFITYKAIDSLGNPLTPATRTVHIVENSAGFLNGRYNVACTCTAIIAGASSPTVAMGNYTAIVQPGAINKRFELVALNIGREKVIPYTRLNGNSIDAGYFSSDYASSSVSGTLAPTKNTFTIESTMYPFSSKVIYRCKNVYTKQLILVANNGK